jgi:7-cyano-7-deazaguanine reductase
MSSAEHSQLGKSTLYVEHYDPSQLFPIPRAGKREESGIGGQLPFHGVDIWNAYELSWLDAKGKPCVALAECRVPAMSPNIIESKSFKLYLNSYSQTRLSGADELRRRLAADLSTAAGAEVQVQLIGARDFPAQRIEELAGELIDDLDISIDEYGPPSPQLLTADSTTSVDETLLSHLLKSNCPVTGQPDWASVQIRYSGPRIDREALLRYLVSFRRHNDFHEQCVERLFVDITVACAPRHLSVYARYTRRGGLDINPFRSSRAGDVAVNSRSARQ